VLPSFPVGGLSWRSPASKALSSRRRPSARVLSPSRLLPPNPTSVIVIPVPGRVTRLRFALVSLPVVVTARDPIEDVRVRENGDVGSRQERGSLLPGEVGQRSELGIVGNKEPVIVSRRGNRMVRSGPAVVRDALVVRQP
jgi:hypothetical protein